MTERHTSDFVVSVTHPSLPGHFPGAPVVPGVVVLDHVLQAMETWRGGPASIRGLKQVKFHAPLLPGERAEIALEADGEALRFQVTRAGATIAQGTFTVSATDPACAGAAHPPGEQPLNVPPAANPLEPARDR